MSLLDHPAVDLFLFFAVFGLLLSCSVVISKHIYNGVRQRALEDFRKYIDDSFNDLYTKLEDDKHKLIVSRCQRSANDFETASERDQSRFNEMFAKRISHFARK